MVGDFIFESNLLDPSFGLTENKRRQEFIKEFTVCQMWL